ncbi:MAG TPA: O-antigen ligase family protein, partial [Ohtaekwangia sp.]|nr:O-antigen ligase family protein [Ohtaekwangia sp.]
FFIIYSVLVYKRINIAIAGVAFFIVVYSLVSFKSDFSLVIKQLINVLSLLLASYFFIVHEDYSFHKIFRKYILVAKYILVIGLIQSFMFVMEHGNAFLKIFPFLKSTNISARFQSLSDEPSFIAITFAPIVFVAMHNLFYRRKHFLTRTWSCLFLLGYLLTLSSSAYVGIALMLVLLYFKKLTEKKLILGSVVLSSIFLFVLISYERIDLIKVRVDDTLYGLTHDFDDPRVYQSVNLSTYALLSNWYVTKKGFTDFPLTGRGLGTHATTYYTHLPDAMKEYVILNDKDANSMALRLLSETGLVGLLLFTLFLIRYKIKFNLVDTCQEEFLWVINSAIFVVIIIVLLRNGNYTSSGKLLFILLYYFSWLYVKKSRRSFDDGIKTNKCIP